VNVKFIENCGCNVMTVNTQVLGFNLSDPDFRINTCFKIHYALHSVRVGSQPNALDLAQFSLHANMDADTSDPTVIINNCSFIFGSERSLR